MTVSVDQIVARKSGRRRRLWMWLSVLVALGIGVWQWQSRSAVSATPTYATAKAQTGDITVTVTAVGTVQPIETVDVAAQISGTITSLSARVNSAVKAGEPLAMIDTGALEATLERDKATLAAQAAALDVARATRDEALDALVRAQSLADRGIATKESLSTAAAAAKRAEANLAAAEAQKAVAAANVKLAELNLAKACICAPIDGVVLASEATLGQPVSAAGTTLFTLSPDLNQMQLELDVDEADVGRVAPGNAATFRVEAHQDQVFTAKVTMIAYASATVDGVVTYSTTLSLDNSRGLLRPGMTAAADITVQEAKGVLAVPNAAFRYSPPTTATSQRRSGLLGMLFSRPASNAPISSAAAEGGTRSLWVLRGGVATEVTVKTGVTDGAMTQILEGDLAAGDLVITGTQAAS
jgi:HlyD family secretion protein